MAKSFISTLQSWIKKCMHSANSANSLLKNRWVLYIVFVISLAQLYSFAVLNEELYAAVFVLVGFLSSFFSKNMIVILCLALVVSSLLKYGAKAGHHEGFTDNTTEDEEPEVAVYNADADADETDVKSDVTADPKNPGVKTGAKISTKETPTVKKTSDAATKKPNVAPPEMQDMKEMKEKINKMSKNVDGQGATEEQKIQFKKLLELQTRLIDGVTGITPLLDETKNILNDFGVSM